MSQQGSLKADHKKATAFIKRIRSFPNPGIAHGALVRDARTFKLTRYVAEVTSAVAESASTGRLKGQSVVDIVELCALMHQRYALCVNANANAYVYM
jgi:hypothetical protein